MVELRLALIEQHRADTRWRKHPYQRTHGLQHIGLDLVLEELDHTIAASTRNVIRKRWELKYSTMERSSSIMINSVNKSKMTT